jgi:hypothetical protein
MHRSAALRHRATPKGNNWRKGQIVAQCGALRSHGDADAGRRPHPSRVPAVHWSDNKQALTRMSLLPALLAGVC